MTKYVIVSLDDIATMALRYPSIKRIYEVQESALRSLASYARDYCDAAPSVLDEIEMWVKRTPRLAQWHTADYKPDWCRLSRYIESLS